MKICLISYGDYEYDGRLRGLYDVCLQLGDVFALTRGSCARDENHHIFQGAYRQFIEFILRTVKAIGKVDLLLLDNRKSIIPGFLSKGYLQPELTVLDCRELYVRKDVKHIEGKLGCLVEDIGIRFADCLIAANSDRARFMQESRGLSETPLVYENLRQLNGGTYEEMQSAMLSIQPWLRSDEYRIVSTGGCDPARLSFEMVEAMSQVEKPARLYLVGPYAQEEAEVVRSLALKFGLNNIEIMGQLNQKELKSLLAKAHIGLVGYHQNDLNNKYCASGKAYEYLYEGLPIVTSSNIPLQRLCAEGVGIASNDYASGINEVIENYDFYRNNVQDYIQKHSIEENDNGLADNLRLLLDAKYADEGEV